METSCGGSQVTRKSRRPARSGRLVSITIGSGKTFQPATPLLEHRVDLSIERTSMRRRSNSLEFRFTKRWRTFLSSVSIGIVTLIASPRVTAAQWLHYPTPDVPRTGDGKPNLNA